MSKEATLPSHAAWGVPVRSLRLDVMDGPDTGATFTTDGETVSVGSAANNGLVLHDPRVSRFHFELSPHASGGVLLVDHGSTNGTFVSGMRLERAVVPAGTFVRVGSTTVRVSDGESVAVELHADDKLEGMIGKSAVMRRLMAQIKKLAESGPPTLLIGESGTGKELIARALHDLGPRRKAPFVTVDCGSLSPTLVGSELFGHERGAFTGADREHVGAFERAHGGTVFLDEIGELPVHMQPALLGVLERKRFRRLGGRADITVDVRVVSATHRDVRGEVNAGSFRLDLYYRVAVATLRVPALRERAEDIPLLAAHFARECGHVGPLESLFKPGALETLSSHHWPGNVRELRNLVEAMVATGEAPAIDRGIASSAKLPEFDAMFEPLLALGYKEARATLLEAFETRYLEALLSRAGGNVSKASREARVDRSHLIDLLKRHGMSV